MLKFYLIKIKVKFQFTVHPACWTLLPSNSHLPDSLWESCLWLRGVTGIAEVTQGRLVGGMGLLLRESPPHLPDRREDRGPRASRVRISGSSRCAHLWVRGWNRAAGVGPGAPGSQATGAGSGSPRLRRRVMSVPRATSGMHMMEEATSSPMMARAWGG